MSLQDGSPRTSPTFAPYLSPYHRPTVDLEDYEAGGIALNDGSQGLDNQIWTLRYEGDEEHEDYGDFIVTGETTGETSVLLNVPNVKRVRLAFDQNMNPFIGYELWTGEAKFYWYDTVAADYVTTTLPSGSRSLACCLDDHRITQTATSDILLVYIRSGTVYVREQTSRYSDEIEWTTGVGQAEVYKVGMNTQNVVQFDVRAGPGNRLSQIMDYLCLRAGHDPRNIDNRALHDIIVRGSLFAGFYSAAEAIRSLQKMYFFDFALIDGVLTSVLRGGTNAFHIPYTDFIIDDEPQYKTMREQEVEFPLKLHIMVANAESDYTPHKCTSERLSSTIQSTSELKSETALNMTDDETTQRADLMHREAWRRREGELKYSTPQKYAYITPSDVGTVEVAPGIVRRYRVEEMDRFGTRIKFKVVRDRASDYPLNTDIVAVTFPTPTAPPASLPGTTDWEFLDLPVLDGSVDTLHYYVAAKGDSAAWSGAELQREIGGEFEEEAQITQADNLGVIDTALPYYTSLVVDAVNTVQVTCSDELYSITDDQLYSGKNACVIGDEIIQFRDVTQLDADTYELSHLLRGRLNTTPVAHIANERFVFLGNPARVEASASLLNTSFNLRAPAYGTVPSAATAETVNFTGESQREWSPASFEAARDGSDWEFSWVPRYRLGTSANPVKSVHMTGYRIQFTVGATVVSKDTTNPNYTYTAADQSTDFGSAQSSFDDVSVMALNSITGEGEAYSEAVA